jgi:hypothetical protein
MLTGNPPEIYLIDPEAIGLAEAGDDVVDFLRLFGGDTYESKRDAIDVALSRARPVSMTADLHQRIEDAIAGRYAAVEPPGFPSVHRFAQPFLPGTITILAGDPGDGKSFLALTWALDLFRIGVPIAIFELEEDRTFWLMRLLAIMAGNGDLTRPEWLKLNPTEARAAREQHTPELNRFAPRLEPAPDRQVTHADLVAWVKARAEAGCRLIMVDPVTALAPSSEPWISDLRLLIELKAIAREHDCSVVLVTHPRIRRGKGGSSALDEMAGGAAFPRFAQTVIWIRRHEKGRICRWVSTLGGDANGRVNRTIKIVKARNSHGGGVEIAAQFDGGTLRFHERGLILDDSDGGE